MLKLSATDAQEQDGDRGYLLKMEVSQKEWTTSYPPPENHHDDGKSTMNKYFLLQVGIFQYYVSFLGWYSLF